MTSSAYSSSLPTGSRRRCASPGRRAWKRAKYRLVVSPSTLGVSARITSSICSGSTAAVKVESPRLQGQCHPLVNQPAQHVERRKPRVRSTSMRESATTQITPLLRSGLRQMSHTGSAERCPQRWHCPPAAALPTGHRQRRGSAPRVGAVSAGQPLGCARADAGQTLELLDQPGRWWVKTVSGLQWLGRNLGRSSRHNGSHLGQVLSMARSRIRRLLSMLLPLLLAVLLVSCSGSAAGLQRFAWC